MNRPFEPHLDVKWPVPNRMKRAALGLLGGMLVAGLGCKSGVIWNAQGEQTGSGSGAGTGTGTGPIRAPGPVREPVPARALGPVRALGSGGLGGDCVGDRAGGQGGDPYAIPTSPPAAVMVATSRLARLSRPQWSNAVRDLLKLTDISDIDSNVSGDALIGFDDMADDLYVTEQLRSELFDASEKLADKVTGDATALARLVPANAPTDTAGKGKAFITAFGQRAFRRPLTTAEVTTHVGLFNQGPTLYPGVDAFKAGVSLVIQAMLQSPYFLYRTELGTAAAGATTVALNDWEVGAKLALSITNTIPDDTLLSAAAAGQLHDKTSVATQAKRLLDGSTGTAGLSDLNLQVYRLGAYDGVTRDPTAFPDWNTNTPAAMKQEVLQFLSWIFAQNRGIKDFYTQPVGFVDSLLAPLYGVTGSYSSDPVMLTKVDLDPTQAVRSADAGGVPVVVHLVERERGGHHPPRRVHRGTGAVQDAAAAGPQGGRDDDPQHPRSHQPATGGDDDREGDVRSGLPRNPVQSARLRVRELRRHRRVSNDGPGKHGRCGRQLHAGRSAPVASTTASSCRTCWPTPRTRTPATSRT